MKPESNIFKELNEIAPTLAHLKKVNGDAVPQGYFLNFGSQLLGKLEMNDLQLELSAIAPLLAKLNKKELRDIPATYFTAFAPQIIQQIQNAELHEIAPTLSKIEKRNTLAVPLAYFTAFPDTVISKIHQAKTVSNTPSWFQKANARVESILGGIFAPKYTLAFSGMVSIVVIAFMLFTNVEKQCADIDCKMAMLSNEELESYLDNNLSYSTDEIFDISTDETSGVIISKDDLYNQALQNISDQELSDALIN